MPWIAECQKTIHQYEQSFIMGNYYEVRKFQDEPNFVEVYVPDFNRWITITRVRAQALFNKPTWIEPGYNVTYNAT